jgi:type II secretory pathway pseudopilin PulG
MNWSAGYVPRSFGWTKFLAGRKVKAMNPRVSNQKTAALTRVEVLVVLSVLAILLAILLSTRSHRPDLNLRREAQQINCINNLKQIGIACRIWEGDHSDKYPMQTSVTNGGTMELANGRNAWINFLVMSNELSTPKVLICPADIDKIAATDFTIDFNNSKISYFINLDADNAYPQMFLSGDDNFAVSGIPEKSGLLELSTNAPIAWTTARHNRVGDIGRVGNIGFTDGSVESVNNSGLTNLLRQTGIATNRLAIP